MPTPTKTEILRSVMKALYNAADEDNYNGYYDAGDIAEHLGISPSDVDEAIQTLLDADMLEACMTLEDDGMQTYVLKDHAIDIVEAS